MRDTKNNRMKPFTFRLPSELQKAIDQAAEKRSLSPSALVRKAIAEFIESNRCHS